VGEQECRQPLYMLAILPADTAANPWSQSFAPDEVDGRIARPERSISVTACFGYEATKCNSCATLVRSIQVDNHAHRAFELPEKSSTGDTFGNGGANLRIPTLIHGYLEIAGRPTSCRRTIPRSTGIGHFAV